jgi:hypothetical protein
MVTTRRLIVCFCFDNHLQAQYHYSFEKQWLSDPSCYPLMAIMGLAAFTAVGMSTWAMTHYKGVKIRPEHKHSEIPTYEAAYAPNVSLVEVATRQPLGFNAERYKSLRHEGLGVDHEEWKKAKLASKQA